MSETLEQLAERTKLVKEARAARYKKKREDKQPQYKFLPKAQKQVVDQITIGNICEWLETEEGYVGAAFVTGILADLKMAGASLSIEQEQVLKLLKVLYLESNNEKA